MNTLFPQRKHIAIRGVSDKDRTITTYSSTKEWDRYGERFEADAFKDGLANYLKNPVFLWAHNYELPPIGKGISHSFDDKGLVQTFEFADTDAAEDIFQLYRGGYLNGVSVGFKPVEVGFEEKVEGSGDMGTVFKKAELLEVSAVPVPANPGALVTKGLFLPAMRVLAPEGLADVQAWLDKHPEVKAAEDEPDRIEGLKKGLSYLIAIGKTFKGGKVSDDAARSLLVQTNNIVREMVYGAAAPPVEPEDEISAEQEEAMVKEITDLLPRIDPASPDGKEHIKEAEKILNILNTGRVG